MVQDSAQTRLLNNLLKSTKEYTSSLTSLLVISHTSHSGLQAYASASNPSTVSAIFGVAQALQGADDALVRYAQEVDHWRERLKEVKAAEEEVANILRDREILVTRLIKVSSKKPTRDSVMSIPGSPNASVLSLNLTPQQRLSAAQAELQGCEKLLSEKQRQLDQIRSIAIRDGLEQRCNALATLGTTLSEKGNEGVRALQEGYAASSNGANGIPPINVDAIFRSLPPRPTSPNGLSDGSLAPSQSASQAGTPSSAHPRSSYAQYADVVGPHPDSPVRVGPIQEGGSSDSDEDDDPRNVQVVENQRRVSQPTHSNSLPPPRALQPQREYSSDVGPATNPKRANTLQRQNMRRQESTSTAGGSDSPRKKSGGFFGAFSGLFRGSSKPAPPPEPSSPLKNSNSAWKTRTDRNLAVARGAAHDDSDSDDGMQGNFRTVENRPGPKLTVPAPSMPPDPTATPRVRKSADIGRNGPASGKKLQRSSSTSKVPSGNPPAKKQRGTGSVVGTSTAATADASQVRPGVPTSLMRAGTVKTDNGEPSPRTRTTSLPGTPKQHHLPGAAGVSSPDAPPPRNPARAKPLKLTGAVEKDPNAWIHHTPGQGASSAGVSRNTSIRSNASGASKGGAGSHKRGASLDVKSSNLMSLVEDVVADRQRSENIRPLQENNSASPRMMLPSEYMKATMPAHGYGTAGSASPSVPAFIINPPTPNEPSSSHSRHNSHGHSHDKGKGKERQPSERRDKRLLPHQALANEEAQTRHSPPPRSASPLRSAMRHSTLNGQPVLNIPAPPKAPPPVVPDEPNGTIDPVAPVPVRPVSISRASRGSMSLESDGASAYETAPSESEGEEEQPSSRITNGVAVEDSSATPKASRLVPIQSGSPPSTVSAVTVSTEQGDAANDGGALVSRRKSVRLDVPPTPDGNSFYGGADDDALIPPPPPKRMSIPSQWSSHIADPEASGAVRDVWANAGSSDEDEAYKRARRSLNKAIKKEKEAHAEAMAVVAASGPGAKKAKRHSLKR